jgi:ribosomal protein L15
MNLNDIHRGVQKSHARPVAVLAQARQTAGRGHKGQWSHNGVSFLSIFQGGHDAAERRIPSWRFQQSLGQDRSIVNVGDLNAVTNRAIGYAESLVPLIWHAPYDELKILGNGEVTKKLRSPPIDSARQPLTKSLPPARRSCCPARLGR